MLKKIATGGRPHNTLCSPDGKRMYLGPKGSYHVLIADAATHKLVGEIPLSDAPRPIALSKDEKRLYANVDTLIGFEVADVAKRKVIHRVEAEVPEELLRKASRSHGIGLRPGEKELWMCDVYHDRTYVFDLTAEPPRQIATHRDEGRRLLDVLLAGRQVLLHQRADRRLGGGHRHGDEEDRGADRGRQGAEADAGGGYGEISSEAATILVASLVSSYRQSRSLRPRPPPPPPPR